MPLSYDTVLKSGFFSASSSYLERIFPYFTSGAENSGVSIVKLITLSVGVLV